MTRWLFGIALLCVGCSAQPRPAAVVDVGASQHNGQPDAGAAADASGTSDVAVGSDARVGTDVGGASGPPFEVPAAAGTYTVDFGVSIDGSGSAGIGAVSVSDGAGTVAVDGSSLPVGLYRRQVWQDFNYTLFQGIAVAADRWWVLWFYCSNGQLQNIYFESTSGDAMTNETATGTCTETAGASQVSVDFPPSTVGVQILDDSFTVASTDLNIGPDETGTLTTDSGDFDVYVFDHVDCSQGCGANGWHELHAIIRDPASGDVCFAIVYLFLDGSPALVTYAFSLPSLRDPLGGTITLPDLTWDRP